MQKVVIKNLNENLKMDIHTKRNLELTETLRLKQRNYSLIWLLDKTKTAMGSRLLKNYIENPILDKETLNKRYDMVEVLLKEFILKSDLQELPRPGAARLCARRACHNKLCAGSPDKPQRGDRRRGARAASRRHNRDLDTQHRQRPRPVLSEQQRQVGEEHKHQGHTRARCRQPRLPCKDLRHCTHCRRQARGVQPDAQPV